MPGCVNVDGAGAGGIDAADVDRQCAGAR
jgi:hypothetical protein